MGDAQTETEAALGFFPMDHFYDAGSQASGDGELSSKAPHEVACAAKYQSAVLHVQ
jgi:hypothetical protein